MLPPKPDEKEIKEYREEHECGLPQAKRELMQEWREDCLQQMKRQAQSHYGDNTNTIRTKSSEGRR